VDKSYISKVEVAAKQTGDNRELSYADKTILALALSEQNSDMKLILVSSDYAVLNTAIHLNMEILDLSGKLSESRIWLYYCPACNNKEKTPGLNLECSICGTKMIRRTRKRSKLPKSE
jgi:rRNA maturation endonuclease Nob1